MEQLPRSPLALAVVGMLVVVVVLLGLVWQMRQAQLGRLSARIAQLQPKKVAVDELLASVQALRDQRTVYQRLKESRSQWAQALNALSDATPEGVWFTDLALDPTRGLTIQGSAIGRGGEEMVRIGHLVQDLKRDTRFSTLLQDMQIESIKTAQEEDIEIINFNLTCRLVNPAIPASPK